MNTLNQPPAGGSRQLTVSARCVSWLLVGVSCWVATAAWAHHAAQAQFNVELSESLQGSLTKIEMINPHPQLYFAVTDESGATIDWRVEAPSIVALRRMGLLRALEIGDHYTIQYSPARNGKPIALMLSLTDSSGVAYGVTGVNVGPAR